MPGDGAAGRLRLTLSTWLRAGTLLAAAGIALLPAPPAEQRRPAPVTGFSVVTTFPHDPGAFTQGLVYAEGEFYESTGLEGQSTLRRVDIATGRVLQKHRVPDEHFAEGLALVGDDLIQLTWKDRIGFVYERKTFGLRQTFTYAVAVEGWGLAYDPAGGLVMSDGTDRLFFLDPKTFDVLKTVRVSDGGRPVIELNELEWIDGEIWANVWRTDRIARINASTGVVTSWVDLSTLWPPHQRTPGADVLNGIAYDPAGRRIFVTGKSWPRVYQIVVQ